MPKVTLTAKEKLLLDFQKCDSKYNRLWEQLTNIILFILASAVAYVIGYVQVNTNTYLSLQDSLRASNLLNFVTKILIASGAILSIGIGFLLAHLISAGLHIHKIMREQEIN